MKGIHAGARAARIFMGRTVLTSFRGVIYSPFSVTTMMHQTGGPLQISTD